MCPRARILSMPTAWIAEANKEVLKAVAEAKEPQKKGPYVHKIYSGIQGKSC